MLGWLLVVLALGALVFDPGVGGRVVAAGAVLAYLLFRSGRRDGDPSGEGPDGPVEPPLRRGDGPEGERTHDAESADEGEAGSTGGPQEGKEAS